MKGVFITFEGIEGSGKSTQITQIANYLSAHKKTVALTREPGGTAIGDQVRKILLDPENTGLAPKAELLLYAAGRAQHLAQVILPSLRAGAIVLCDRFSDATIAYQGYGRGLDLELIRSLDLMVTDGMKPDLTLLLDIDAAAGLARARGRNSRIGSEAEARFENEHLSFHERVRRGYLELARQDPRRFHIVDASPPPDVVQSRIRQVIDEVLRKSQ